MALGHFIQRKRTQNTPAERAYLDASIGLSALAGFIGGQCLFGTVVVLNILVDVWPSGRREREKGKGRRYMDLFTLPAIFVMCAASGGAGLPGVLVLRHGRRDGVEGNERKSVLDLGEAVIAGGIGAGVVFFVLVLVWFLVRGTCPLLFCQLEKVVDDVL